MRTVLKTLLVVVVACLRAGAAAVSVELVLEQEQYLPNESLPVGVRITNYSGRTLKLGADEQWLQLGVEADSGAVVVKYGDPPVKGEFELPNAKSATRRVDIARFFDMGIPGRYRLLASVHIPELGLDLSSPAAKVNIVSGTKVWELDFALPNPDPSARSLGEGRRYELLQATHQKQIKLYVRISDPSGARVFRIFPLGPTLTFSRPEAFVDRRSQLHVLFQVSAKTFTYHVVSPDGEERMRRTYQYSNQRPVLRVQEDGTVKVHGGARIRVASDLPVEADEDAKATPATGDAPAPAPDRAPPPPGSAAGSKVTPAPK